MTWGMGLSLGNRLYVDKVESQFWVFWGGRVVVVDLKLCGWQEWEAEVVFFFQRMGGGKWRRRE